MSHNNNVNGLGFNVHLEELAPRVNDNPARANGVGMNVHLDAIEDVAQQALGNYRAEIADFRIQSHTGLSTANARVSAKERETLTPLLQSLADSLASRGKIARINPNLNIIVIIKANGTRETIYADQLEGDAKAHFERLKLHYNTKHGGFACTRPTFTNGNKANLKGFQPFYTKVSEDPKDLKARAFIAHENFAKITEGMTEEKKLIVAERVKLAEILVVQKIKRYESLIEKVKTSLKEAQDSGDEDEVEGLQKDLTKLEKKLQELKRLDPVALYWLAAFYPEDPDDKEECALQARIIEAKAKEILKDSSHAHDLASVLIKDRQEYFFFSGSKGMQNTQPMEDILREVVSAENGRDVNQLDEEYESDLVREKLEKIHDKLNERIESRVEKSAPKKAEFAHRAQLAHEFVHERLRMYKNLEIAINGERGRLVEEVQLRVQKELEICKSAAIGYLEYCDIKVRAAASIEVVDLVDLLKVAVRNEEHLSEEKREELNNYLERLEAANNRVNELKANMVEFERSAQAVHKRIEELERLSNIDFELLAHYYVEGSKKQKHNFNALAAAAKRRGYNEVQIKQLKQDIMNPEVRKMLRSMTKFKKKGTSDTFVTAALRSLEKGGELMSTFKDVVKALEEEIYNFAKARFNEPINPSVNSSHNIINNDDDDNEDFERIF